jgi:hypothetical protein
MMFFVRAKEHYSQTNKWELLEPGKLLSATRTGLSVEDKMAEKLILPTEVKVCATCSYWDGERHVDAEMKLVVVSEKCEGECLVQEVQKPGLHDVRQECDCIWEDLEPDAPIGSAAADHKAA